jgi:hypothetical protein
VTKNIDNSYINDGARTVAEMKDAFEQMRDVMQELGAGRDDDSIEEKTISSNAITLPDSNFIRVLSETVTYDDLDTIASGSGATLIPYGRVIHIMNKDTDATLTTGKYITVKHDASPSAGDISLIRGTDFVLYGKRVLSLVAVGTTNPGGTAYWQEIHREFSNAAEERAWLGLEAGATTEIASGIGDGARGKALVVASGTTLAANDVLGVDASGKIIVGAPASVDAATLDGLDSTGFIRVGTSAEQGVAGAFNASADITVHSEGSGDAKVSFRNAADVSLGTIVAQTDGSMYLYQAEDGVSAGSIKLYWDTDHTSFQRKKVAGGTYSEVVCEDSIKTNALLAAGGTLWHSDEQQFKYAEWNAGSIGSSGSSTGNDVSMGVCPGPGYKTLMWATAQHRGLGSYSSECTLTFQFKAGLGEWENFSTDYSSLTGSKIDFSGMAAYAETEGTSYQYRILGGEGTGGTNDIPYMRSLRCLRIPGFSF